MKITAENIMENLNGGDMVTINGNGPFKVTYCYWHDDRNTMFSDSPDLGFDIDSDFERGLICNTEVSENLFDIQKVS